MRTTQDLPEITRRMEMESSPVHRAVWETEVPGDLFSLEERAMPSAARSALDRSLEVVRRRRAAGHGVRRARARE